MVITKRDLELFRKLSNYGMFSTKQIGTLFFDGVALTTVLRRLRVLEDKHYLKRVTGLKSQELLWVLTSKGAAIAKVPIPKRHWSKNMLEHDFKLLELRLLLEELGIAKSWIPEHTIRSMVVKKHGLRDSKDRVIPDGLMGIEVNGKKVSVAIELELTMKNRKKMREIIRRYGSKYELYGIWYIAPKKFILDAVWRLWSDVQYRFTGTKLFASMLDDVMKNKLEALLMGEKPHRKLNELWQSTGAHRLSTQVDEKTENKNEITNENHAPILDIAS